MRTIETKLRSLVLGLLLSSLSACSPPVGPDQQEAGLEKSDADQQRGGSDKAVKLDNFGSQSPEQAEIHNTSKHAVIDAYLRCFDGCADKSADDRLTCHDDCTDQVSAGSGDVAASACPRSCIKALGSCLLPCDHEPSEEHSATCRNQCRALAQNCVDGCN
jgi:hypothetical protein